ncbi:isopeptide-forming domain-containing fimbrial protein (plasmid) [Latilactobacillus sakei]
MKIKKLLLTTVAALSLGVVGIKSHTAHAASILEAPNTSVPKEGETVDGKYSFIAQFIKGKTTLKAYAPSGIKWGYHDDPSADPNYGLTNAILRLSSVPDSAKGKVGVVYQNVGNYNGKTVDLKIALTDWVKRSSNGNYAVFTRDMIAHTSQADAIQMKWTYIDHETGKSIKVNGFYTFNDIDTGQGFSFSKSFSQHIDHIYVPIKNSPLLYDNSNGFQSYYSPLDLKTDPLDDEGMLTLLYSGTDSMDLTWAGGQKVKDYAGKLATTDNLDISQKPTALTENYNSQYIGGDFFQYLAKKPLRTETIPPLKFVSDDDQKMVKDNTLKNQADTFSYDVQFQVPDEWSQFYYKSYALTDELIPELKLNSIKVTDETGKDVTKSFENKTKDNHINMSATNASLKTAAFYNHTYMLHMDVQLRTGQNFHKYVDEKTGVTTFKNTAILTIDGKPASSNTVQTHVNKIKSEIDKWLEA